MLAAHTEMISDAKKKIFGIVTKTLLRQEFCFLPTNNYCKKKIHEQRKRKSCHKNKVVLLIH